MFLILDFWNPKNSFEILSYCGFLLNPLELMGFHSVLPHWIKIGLTNRIVSHDNFHIKT